MLIQKVLDRLIFRNSFDVKAIFIHLGAQPNRVSIESFLYSRIHFLTQITLLSLKLYRSIQF